MARRKTHEKFVAEVEALVGDEYLFIENYVHSMQKISVFHAKCSTSYKVRPNDFLSGYRCPKCAGVKKMTISEFKLRVSEMYSDEYLVLGKYVNQQTKIKIRHNKCMREFEIRPTHFLHSKVTCTECSGYKKKTHREFISKVSELTSGEYVVIGEYKNSKTKIEIKHTQCGTHFYPQPNTFLQGTRCPKCRESKGERCISEWLTEKCIKFIPQVRFEKCKYKNTLPFDFGVYEKDYLTCLIEYDGVQHFKVIDRFDGKSGFIDTQRRDRIKDKYCADNGIPLIRIPYWEYDNIDAILTQKLLPLLKERKYSTAS